MSTTHLQIHLFGAFALVDGDKSIASLYAARLQSLLAFLLIQRGAPQSRQQLAFRFWPETSDAQAQTNLRQLLHRLKQRLPNSDDYLLMDERSVSWRAAATYTLDVAEFEQALLAASNTDGPARISALERAAAAYSGDLLPSCYDEWIIPLRERLAQQFVTALEQLVLLHEERRNYAAAIAHAQRLLGYDPLHEATYRRLMRLFALYGDRAAALRVYHTCVSMLDRELDALPSAATREAYERLLQVDDAHLARHSPQSPFVGRAAAWQELQKLWRAASRGCLHGVCIQGEAGIGKTRIAEELLHWARQQGIRTLHAHAYSTESSMSYAPLVEALRAPVAQPALARLAPVWRTELARLLPELLAADPALTAPQPLTETLQRQHLYDALLRAVTPDAQPLILLLDDLQWCDAETLDWLLYLVNHRMDARLLLVAAERSEEMTPEHPAARFLLELRRLGVLTDLPLTALDAAETTLLAEGVAGQKLDSAHAQQIFAATEGNPLFVVETMRSLDATGAAGEVVLPPKVQGVIRARLAQLSPAARDLAGVAAAIGRSFSADLLVAASAEDEETVVRSLDELWQRRIVREQGVNGYEFSHDRLREVAYAALQPARRRLLHRRLAQALEQLHPDAPATVCVQLAHHYEQSGAAGQAIHYLQQAAAAARRLYSYREAIAFLERAIGLLHFFPTDAATLERELELQMALCNDWATITNYMGAEVGAAYGRALFLCRQLDITPHLFTAYWGLHEVALYRGDYAESLELAADCMRIAQGLGDVGLLLQAHHALWAPYHFLGQHTEALAHMQAGLALYQHPEHEAISPHYGWHDAAACALEFASLSLWQLGFLDQAAHRQQQLIEHANRLARPVNSADGYGFAAAVYHLLCAPALAQPYAEMTLRIGVERGYPGIRILGAIPLGWSLALQGRSSEGLALIEQAIEDDQAMGHRLRQSQYFVMLAEAYLAAGRPDAAIAAVERGIDAFVRYRDRVCAPDLWMLKGAALLALGAADTEVEECYYAALVLAQELGAKTSELRAAVRLARLRQQQGRSAEGLAVLREVYGWFSEGFDTPDLHAAKALLDELTAQE